MAVAAAGQLNDPMLLRVPPASIKALGEYGQSLAKRGVGYNMVVTKVSFDIEAESPKLTFKPIGFLDDAGFAEVQEMVGSDMVSNILGANPVALEAPAEEAPAKPKAKPAPAPAAEEEEEAEEAPAPKAEAAKPKAPAKAKSAPVMEDEVDFDLDGINFDD
jgi:hypothetical protein